MWAALLGLIPGVFGTINNISAAIANERIAALNAKTDQQKIESQERISTLQARRDLMIAESSRSNINAFIRAAIAFGPMCFLTKIFIWDKVLNYWTDGSTDKLDPNLWNVVMVVLGFYFLYEGAIGVTKVIKA